MDLILQAGEFDWDAHNTEKIWNKHQVKFTECEEAFFDPVARVYPDEAHSIHERRFYLLGQTKEGRHLFIVFMQRRGKVRVISARSMNRKERKVYHEKEA